MTSTRVQGVIWITGLPNAGKTTVADLVSVDPHLRDRASVIRLDGDLLRFVLQSTAVESDADRRRLGVSYARLALSLAQQGHVVIVSVVAMYSEVFAELESSSLPVLTVHLDATIDDLKERDWRGVFAHATDSPGLTIPMELPEDVFTVSNASDRTPQETCRTILERAEASGLLTPTPVKGDAGIQKETWAAGTSSIRRHWDGYYSGQENLPDPSSFELFVDATTPIRESDRVLDYGCGNGRDTFYFGAKCATVGLDVSDGAIDLCRSFLSERPESKADFALLTRDTLEKTLSRFVPTVVYSRFVLHAMTADQETSLLDTLAQGMPPGSHLYIECRTVNDPMFDKGIKLSETERVYGHYRRFIEPARLQSDLTARGFAITYASESRGVASLGADDPAVLRIMAVRDPA